MGGQPTLYRWRRGAKGNWEIAQTLGPDSLGRFGTGSFSDAGGVTELVVNAYGPTPRFDECSTCPHVFWVRSFEWRDEGFVRIEERLVPSPYATFVRFVTALATNDLELARSRTDDPGLAEEAIRLGLTQPRGLWRVAPATDESAHEMVFMRGKAEAYRVNFTEFGDDWVITAITATANVIE
jgi:hypothetical protein